MNFIVVLAILTAVVSALVAWGIHEALRDRAGDPVDQVFEATAGFLGWDADQDLHDVYGPGG